MAGGNSPRQKMINLMYLVFISMLALNMGKEVLSAFGLMNEKLEASNEKANNANINAIQALEQNNAENPDQFAEAFQKSKKVKELSDSFYNYIEGIKGEIMNQVGEDKKDYQVMDKSDYLDQKFFVGDNYKPEGEEFVRQINDYKAQLVELLGGKEGTYGELVGKIDGNFNTNDVVDREGVTRKWLNYNFEGFPYIASVAKLSMMQSDIRDTEQEVYAEMLKGQLKSQISMTNYTTLLEQSKGAYYQGESFDGAIVLGRKDASTRPNEVELMLDGRKLSASEFQIEDGKVKLKVGAGNAGEHKITGNLYFDQDGKRIAVPVSQVFSTIPKPNAAVISADKMNVVYRGVNNPMTISMPGVPDNKMSASAPGLSKKSGSSYTMKPGQGREVTINVSGEIDGQRFSSSKTFRIKDIPRAVATIAGEAGSVKLPKANLAVATVNATFEDFDFDIKPVVKQFRIFIPGQPSIVVHGNKLNDQAKSALNRAKRGDIVQILDISASAPGFEGYMKKLAPISIEITN
ncbi:type IX secretion system motor protein PorM/GldM [Capnocytophaga canimorsus]|uniref:type IX secretion system motor protein PorM/GldM n=1 Tax=Capnocytophaga canimorsus TaxID=28188 RepID=UPI0037D4B99C